MGGPEEVATGDWQVADVASLLGLVDIALVFAERNLQLGREALEREDVAENRIAIEEQLNTVPNVNGG